MVVGTHAQLYSTQPLITVVLLPSQCLPVISSQLIPGTMRMRTTRLAALLAALEENNMKKETLSTHLWKIVSHSHKTSRCIC